jgi:hypothetical protein
MLRSFVIATLLLAIEPGQAEQPADALKTCLVDNTTGRDRKDLAKWIFFAMAAHPELKPHAGPSAVTGADESARVMAALVMRLLTETCVKETRAVVSNSQGNQALSESFRVAFERLGQIAMVELMTDKDVQSSMGQFERYVDTKRFSDAIAGK